MKKRKTEKRGAKGDRDAAALTTDFTRGFVATALLSALQDRGARPAAPLDAGRALRHALQGGVALAAGSAVAGAVQRRDYVLALTAVAVGAGAVYGIEHWFAQPRAGDGEV